MSIAIAYRDAKGGVCIYYPNPKDRRRGETQEAWIERSTARAIPSDATEVTMVDPDTLPKDRAQRHKWTLKDGRVVVSDD